MKRDDSEKDGLEPLLDEVRRAYRRLGEPSGEMLLAYFDGQLPEDQRHDLELILSLRPDLQEEIAARVEMRSAPHAKVGAHSAFSQATRGPMSRPGLFSLRRPAILAAAAAVLLVSLTLLLPPTDSVKMMDEVLSVSQSGVRASDAGVVGFVEGETMEVSVAAPPAAKYYLLLEVRGRGVQRVSSDPLTSATTSIKLEADGELGVSFLVMIYSQQPLAEGDLLVKLAQKLENYPILSGLPASERQAQLEEALTSLIPGQVTVQLSGLYQTVKR